MLRRAIDADPLPNGAGSRPQTGGGKLVDDSCVARLAHLFRAELFLVELFFAEIPALQQTDSHGLQIVSAYDIDLRS